MCSKLINVHTFLLGIMVGHVTPEAQCGGPIAIVENNDVITIDPEKKTIDLVSLTFI